MNQFNMLSVDLGNTLYFFGGPLKYLGVSSSLEWSDTLKMPSLEIAVLFIGTDILVFSK